MVAALSRALDEPPDDVVPQPATVKERPSSSSPPTDGLWSATGKALPRLTGLVNLARAMSFSNVQGSKEGWTCTVSIVVR